MSWELKTIRPKRASVSDRKRSPSPSLIRFFAGVGFSIFGIFSLKFGMKLFGFESTAWLTPTWSSRFMLVVVGSLLMGVLGGLMCLGLAAQVDVRSDRTNYVMSVLWHYLANGTLIFIFLMGLVLSKKFDKEGARRFVLEFGPERMSLYTVAICSLGSLTVAVVLLLTRLLKENERPRLAPCIALALPVGLTMFYTLFAVFGIASRDWILAGFVFSLVLVLTSAYMIDRDRNARHRLVDR
jgi:hypothetical protein